MLHKRRFSSLRTQRILTSLIILIELMVVSRTASAEELKPLTSEERIRIQKYFSVAEAQKQLIEEHEQRLETGANRTKQKEGMGFEKEYRRLQGIFEQQEAELFKEHGITKEEFQKISGEILENPGKLMAYVKAGGVLPKGNKEDKIKQLLTPKERLRQAGIILMPSEETSMKEALNNPSVRLDAITVLGESQDPLAIPYLREQLQSGDFFVRLASAEALCRLEQFEGVPFLLESVKNQDQLLLFRMAAVHSAGACHKDSSVISTLLELLETEQNGSLRLQIALQINQWGGISKLDALIKIRAEEKDEMVRHLLDRTIQAWEQKKRIRELSGAVP